MKVLWTALLCWGMFSISEPEPADKKIVWVRDYDQAVKLAQKTDKMLLLNFTGSDWCGWCKRLDAEVFSKASFVEFAQENFICVKLDFPRYLVIPEAERRQNEKLMMKHRISGFPSILVLDPKEKLVVRTGYRRGGPDAYVDFLKQNISTP